MIYNKYKTIYFLFSVSPVTKIAFTFICKIIHFVNRRWGHLFGGKEVTQPQKYSNHGSSIYLIKLNNLFQRGPSCQLNQIKEALPTT